MTAAEVLERLRLDGVGVVLALDLEATAEPNPETLQLIREHRDALLEYLAGELVGTVRRSQSPGLTLYGDLLKNLMVWLARYHELRLEHPGGFTLLAKPEHAAHHLTASAWTVLYDETHTILALAGVRLRRALSGKTELEPTQPEPMTAEKVVN